MEFTKKGVKTSRFHGFDAISSKAVVDVNVNGIWLRFLDKGLPLHHVIVKSSKLFTQEHWSHWKLVTMVDDGLYHGRGVVVPT